MWYHRLAPNGGVEESAHNRWGEVLPHAPFSRACSYFVGDAVPRESRPALVHARKAEAEIFVERPSAMEHVVEEGVDPVFVEASRFLIGFQAVHVRARYITVVGVACEAVFVHGDFVGTDAAVACFLASLALTVDPEGLGYSFCAKYFTSVDVARG